MCKQVAPTRVFKDKEIINIKIKYLEGQFKRIIMSKIGDPDFKKGKEDKGQAVIKQLEGKSFKLRKDLSIKFKFSPSFNLDDKKKLHESGHSLTHELDIWT